MLSITQPQRQCTIAGFNECNQDGETGCCDVSKTFTACPTGYFSCEKPEFVERGYVGACCPQGYTCLIAPSCVSHVTQPPETSVSVELVTETSTIISTIPFTVTSTEVSTKTSISTVSAETSLHIGDTLTSAVLTKVYEIKLSIGTPQHTRLSKATVVGASIGSLAAFFVMGLTLLWWLKKWRGSRVPMVSVEQQPVKYIQQPKAELPATAPMSELPGGPGQVSPGPD